MADPRKTPPQEQPEPGVPDEVPDEGPPDPDEVPGPPQEEEDRPEPEELVELRFQVIEDRMTHVEQIAGEQYETLLSMQRGVDELKGMVSVVMGLSPGEEQKRTKETAKALVRRAPDGMIRFFSPFTNLRIVLQPEANHILDGRMVSIRQEEVQFANNVADVDEETATRLEQSSGYGEDFWIDNTAIPQMGPQVVDGPKSSGGPVRERPALPRTAMTVSL